MKILVGALACAASLAVPPAALGQGGAPAPDFDEYFYARNQAGFRNGNIDDVLLPIETARGCWWGMKNHCTFCGLNRSGMEFRAKSTENILEQLETLSKRYGILDFNAIDNIMAPEYTDKLFGRLIEANSLFELRLRPRRLTNEIAAFLDECWRPRHTSQRRRSASA